MIECEHKMARLYILSIQFSSATSGVDDELGWTKPLIH